MNCCINCFESIYLNDIILRNKKIGCCDYCYSQEVNIYDASELNIFFKGIIDLYEINSEAGDYLHNQISKDFPSKVFTQKLIDSNNAPKLINDILNDDIDDYADLISNHVKLKYKNEGIEEVIIKPLSLSWDKFSEEIKCVNRFHFVNALDLEKMKSLFKHFEKDIPKGKKYYRARICENNRGFSMDEMGNPPSHLAKSGRANPNGISYLYVASEVTTTLYEARASLLDYVSIGTFRLEEGIKIVNLSQLTYDVFRLAELESLEEVLIHSPFIEKLEKELSKPRRKNDSELDYLPTQYLSELIKSMGFDGIEFKSSLYPEGQNLAVFYPQKLKCIDASVYEVTSIDLDFNRI